MSAARSLLDEAVAAGFEIECRGGRLRVRPTPPPDLVDRLRQQKAALVELLTPPSRGPCIHCGQPVTRIGEHEGLRNAYGQLLHLRCPEPEPAAPAQPESREKPSEPIDWTLRDDVRLVVEDLADQGWRPGRIARHLGLTPAEVIAILRRTSR